MYIKENMTDNDYQNVAYLMRDLMVKWKDKNSKKILKEISMPDMIDIICKHGEVREIYDFINIYWDQIKEEKDPIITTRIYNALDSNSMTVWNLCGSEGFTSRELEDIIIRFINSTPVIYIKEDL